MPRLIMMRPSHGLRRAIALLMILVIALGNMLGSSASTAFALPQDPIDPPPLDDPFVAPEHGFGWSMPSRFGVTLNRNGHSMVEYHWVPDPDRPGFDMYDPAYVSPSNYRVGFDGCQTEDEENGLPPTHNYTWEIAGQVLAEHGCQFQYYFSQQGTYHVKLTISGEPYPHEQDVTVRDFLIVSIGDSYASGQGNPDVPQWIFDDDPFERPSASPAIWQDQRCHRSALAGPARAAMGIERRDLHTSVTFISFACSGATIERETFENDDPQKSQGVGVLAP